MASKRKVSEVWAYFEENTDHLSGKCMLCKSNFSLGKKKSTKNLWDHLRSRHKKEFHVAEAAKKKADQASVAVKASKAAIYTLSVPATDAFDAVGGSSTQTSFSTPHLTTSSHSGSGDTVATQQTIFDFVQPVDKFKPGNPKQKEITYLLGEWLADGMLPYNLVSNLRFQTLVEALNPRYDLPSEWYIRTVVIPDILQRVKAKISEIIDTQLVVFSATTDMWTSDARHSYISLTVHFIDAAWSRKMVVLSCQQFHGSHNGENIASVLHSILGSWHLDDKIHIFIRDSGTNFIAAMEKGNFESAACFLHTLDLVINKGLLAQRMVHDMMTRLQKFITFYRSSSIAKEKLEEAQRHLKLPVHSLIKGEETRWMSYAKSLRRALEQKNAIILISGELDRSLDNTITANDWKIMDSVVQLLQPFADATNFAEREKACISEVIPTLFKLKKQLQKLDVPGAKTMRDELLDQMKFYFSGKGTGQIKRIFPDDVESVDAYSLATLLDPRFKDRVFQDKEAAASARIRLEWLTYEMLLSQNRPRVGGEPFTVGPAGTGPSLERPKVGGFFADIADDLVNASAAPIISSSQAQPNEALKTIAKNLVLTYLQESLINPQSDPLDYWKTKEMDLPQLARLAKKYLSPPSGSAASEREFKVASEITGGDRIRLLPKNAENLLFLKYNLRALGYHSLRLPLPSQGTVPTAPASESAAAGTFEDESMIDDIL